MGEFLEEKVLDELFESKYEAYSHHIITESKEYKEQLDKFEHKVKEMLNYVQGAHYDFVESKLDDALFDVLGIVELWDKEFYKLGLADGMKMNKELQELVEERDTMEKVLNSFMNDYESNFEEYFDRHRINKLKNREDYAKLLSQKRKIFEKYPKVLHLFEDDLVEGFSEEEKDAMGEVFSIQSELSRIERKEAFKLGGKEAYIFFEEQDMLNI